MGTIMTMGTTTGMSMVTAMVTGTAIPMAWAAITITRPRISAAPSPSGWR